MKIKHLQIELTVESVREAKKVKLKRFMKHDRIVLFWEDRAKSIFKIHGRIEKVLDQELVKAINSRTSYQCIKCGNRVWEKGEVEETEHFRSTKFKCLNCGYIDTIMQILFPEKEKPKKIEEFMS